MAQFLAARGRAATGLTTVTGIASIAFAVAFSAAGTSAAAAPRPAAQGRVITTSVWQPAADTDWMWELGQPLDTNNASLMGTGVTAYNGDTPPGDDPALYDIDGSKTRHRRSRPSTSWATTSSATSRSEPPATTTRRRRKASRPPTTSS